MSEPVNENVIDQGFGLMGGDQQQTPPVAEQPQEQQQTNPLWDELLSQIPQQFHNIVTPTLQKWDSNYTQGMQKVHSQYEPYKPFMEQQVDPAQLNEAMLVYQAMQDDPTTFIKAVQEFYKLEQGQAQQVDQETGEEELPPFDITQLPEWQQQSQLLQTMAQAMLQQNEQAEEAAAEAQLEQEFEAAKQQFGNFDETWVAQHMYLQGSNINDAVAAYKQFEQNIIAQHQRPGATAPVLMGSGGGLPSQQTPVSGMSSKERRAYIAQRLAEAAQNGG